MKVKGLQQIPFTIAFEKFSAIVAFIILVIITSCDKHFYDEIDIEIGKLIECKVVVNHHVELTEEEKAEARQQAIKRAENEAYAKMKQQREKATAKQTATVQQPQPSLFDF